MRSQTSYSINPEVLVFMRKSSGMGDDYIARKLKISISKYRNIENGLEKITENDLIHFADIYKRPLVAFYETDISGIPEMPHDYRLNRDKKLSPEVFLAKRKALYLSEELKEITGKKTELPEIQTKVTASELANEIRKLIKIDYDFISELKKEPVINYYKSLIEENFFIPVIEHPLKTNGVRAFSVYGEICVMVLNESDSNEVKLFSLFHEFCHLLKRQDGICTADLEKNKNTLPEERYCDEFSALILMPENRLRKEIPELPVTTLTQIASISKKFGVSKLVTLIRMKELNIINPQQYKSLKIKLESNRKPGFGRRNWEQTYIKRTSRLVLNQLIESFHKGDLTYASLATITGIKDKYLQKFI